MALGVESLRVLRGGRLVLDVLSLELRERRTTAILGPNGSGKTTLLRVLAGLEPVGEGRVHLGGAAVAGARDLAYAFQEIVFLRQSVRDNLGLGLRLRGVSREETWRRIEHAVALLGVAHLLDRRADRLSGGEARRVSLARALCLRARLVLLDEPLAGLDEQAYTQLVDELPQVLAAFDATTLLVSHRCDEALRLAEDLVVMVDGRVRAAGTTHDVVMNPRSSDVAKVLGYTVLAAGGRRVAVAAGGLQLGPGPLDFLMTVDGVATLGDRREVIGRIDDTRVRAQAPAIGAGPAPGDRVVVSANRVVDVV